MRLRNTIRHWFISPAALFCLALAAGAPRAGQGADDAELIQNAELELEQGRYGNAQNLLLSLSSKGRSLPEALYLRGWLMLSKGEYANSVSMLRQAVEGAKTEGDWKYFRDMATASLEVTGTFKRTRDKDGAFIVAHPPGVDEVLVPLALDSLKAQKKYLESLFGLSIHSPVVVEILPDLESLALLTQTRAEDLERTGTVAVSHMGRILMITPRALERGYPWIETAAHELAHIYITALSRGAAPGWIEEGVARLLQTGWKRGSGDTAALSPVENYLLERAVSEKRLIPLRKLNTSLIRLASQEEAVLAMAQAASFTRYLSKKHGSATFRELLMLLAEKKNIREAVNDIWKSPFSRVYAWWVQSLEGRRRAPTGAVRLLGRRFRRGELGAYTAPGTFRDPQITRKVRLGDLLVKRAHYAAASVEYSAALKMAGDPDPIVVNKLARCELEMNNPEKAGRRLEELIPLYPHFPATFVALAMAKSAQGDTAGALDACRRTLFLDPFDSRAACLMADLLRETEKPGTDHFDRHCSILKSAQN